MNNEMNNTKQLSRSEYIKTDLHKQRLSYYQKYGYNRTERSNLMKSMNVKVEIVTSCTYRVYSQTTPNQSYLCNYNTLYPSHIHHTNCECMDFIKINASLKNENEIRHCKHLLYLFSFLPTN